jgi:hypothetical protein
MGPMAFPLGIPVQGPCGIGNGGEAVNPLAKLSPVGGVSTVGFVPAPHPAPHLHRIKVAKVAKDGQLREYGHVAIFEESQ